MLVAAVLQEHFRSVIADARGKLGAPHVLQMAVVDEVVDVSRVGLKLDLATRLEALDKILYELKTNKPYIFIEQITVRERHNTPDYAR